MMVPVEDEEFGELGEQANDSSSSPGTEKG